MSPSKRVRAWLIHISELTIIRLKLFSNVNYSLEFTFNALWQRFSM